MIEILIVVAVINIIAAIAIPNLLSAVQRGRQKRSMADIKTAATTWETYYVDYSYYFNAGGCPAPPGSPAGIASAILVTEMSQLLIPTYIAKLPLKDGWNNYCFFWVDRRSIAQEYRIESFGMDMSADSYCGMTTSLTNDIVLSNGQFIEWPEGAQIK